MYGLSNMSPQHYTSHPLMMTAGIETVEKVPLSDSQGGYASGRRSNVEYLGDNTARHELLRTNFLYVLIQMKPGVKKNTN